ncbi:MAG: hypothetical protein QOI55_857 [Actinomycetota bacterium]|jgi:hypothetical protein|nr:hypothetical protein [Actinomycetota bacterium]
MSDNNTSDKVNLERRLTRLTTERTTLFALAGTHAGLSKADHARMSAVEREIDECFMAVRQQRAARDARRFTLEGPLRGRGLGSLRPRDGTTH